MEQENQSQQNQEEGQGLVATLRRQLQMMREASGDNNPLLALLESFLSLFLGLDDNSDDPNFEDITDPAERAAAEAEYNRSRRDQERSRYGDARSSANQWTAGDVMANSGRLLELRRELEAANGGRPIRAINPVDDDGYRITSRFGRRESPGGIGSTNHAGVDFAGRNRGDMPPIVAAMPGVVVYSGVRGGYGNMVEIMDIYGVKHRYAHLDSASVRVGQRVEQGERIGVMGTTGLSTAEHLHYEQRDASNNHRNPMLHIDRNAQPVRTRAGAAPQAPETPETPEQAVQPATPAATPERQAAPLVQRARQAAAVVLPPGSMAMVEGAGLALRHAHRQAEGIVDDLGGRAAAVMARLPKLPSIPNPFERA